MSVAILVVLHLEASNASKKRCIPEKLFNKLKFVEKGFDEGNQPTGVQDV